MTLNSTNTEIAPSSIKREIPLPSTLDAELTRMRRDPREFMVLSLGRCKWCPPKSETAYSLSHPFNVKDAGKWCAEHGWLSFDSVKIRPRGEEYIPKKRRKAA